MYLGKIFSFYYMSTDN